MASACPLRPGCAYSFNYPRHNFRGILSSLERRRLIVSSVRDTRREPLDEATTELQPSLQRGRWLVTGQDLDKEAERTFYVESMRGLTEMPPSQISRQLTGPALYLVIDNGEVVHSTPDELTASVLLHQRGRGVLSKVLTSCVTAFLCVSRQSQKTPENRTKRAVRKPA